ANGFNTPLRTIRAVTTAEGEVLSRYNLSVEQVVDPRAVYLLQLAMQQVMREGTGRSAYNTLSSSLALAGKTGTTDNNRDSWFAGYGASYLAVAWMGRDDNEETRFTGSTGALRVWTRLMAALPQTPLETAQPDGIDYYWVDEREQSISAEGCAGARLMPFVSGSQPNRLSECADRRLHSPSSAPNWFERLFN
ncbi:MAG: penicillin-binding protein 1B, partial [Gammaproteobacteria bacterium]|nr:penicillin-binding protein 1B [Gammaproteobacteria bacterium]